MELDYSHLNKVGDRLTPVERTKQQKVNKRLNRKAFINGIYQFKGNTDGIIKA